MFKPIAVALVASLLSGFVLPSAHAVTLDLNRFSHYTSTLEGERRQPVSFIFIGSSTQMQRYFQTHAWFVSYSPTYGSEAEAYRAAQLNLPFLNAPCANDFYDHESHEYCFEQPTTTLTVRQRHQTRLWETRYFLANGQQVWVATAGLDQVTTLPPNYLDNMYDTQPNVDAERDRIVRALRIQSPQYIQLVEPQQGTSGLGDPFTTDGRAVVIHFNPLW